MPHEPEIGAPREPTLFEAVVTLVLVFAVVLVGIRLQGGLTRSPLPLLLALGVVSVVGLRLHAPWSTIQQGLVNGIARVGIAVFVVLLVGALVGVWIQAGIIPSLVYYGLRLVTPGAFLATAFLACAVMSTVTGTSYGTMGTVGVALMGIAAGLEVSLPIAAGAVISGAFFGDKMSPLSETTNIAAAMGAVDLFAHIRSMLFTTVPAAVITLGLFLLVRGAAPPTGAEGVEALRISLEAAWDVHWLHLLPILLVLAMTRRRTPALVALCLSVLLGAVWALLFQGASPATIVDAAVDGFGAGTGVESIDSLFGRGGMAAMAPVAMIIIAAGALGGGLGAIGVLERALTAPLSRVRSPGTLVVSVLVSCYGILVFTGSTTLSLVLPGQVFLPAFRANGVDARVMTRTLEDGGTLASPLVPWTGAALVATQMLGVPTLSYLPYVWFVLLVPVFSVLFGYTGIGVWRTEAHLDEGPRAARASLRSW
jgi:NhaC family Na+:H+ antiporter